ncbi:flavin reductase family protein [Thermotoga sp. SG1]|uniref:flavin reductase family protein n=1 Tax=Thermotoga sp. SG1 TaxID=126739 RepID=UPI000C7895D9
MSVYERLLEDLRKGRVILTSKMKDRVNGMTIGWGFFGIMWEEEYFITAVRPQRFTWRLIKESRRFTLNFLSEEHREALNYFGRVSGYQEEKFKKGLLHLDELEGFTAPIKEAHTLIECSVTFANNVEPFVLPQGIIDRFYKDHGFHTLFFGKIEKVLQR